MPSAQYGSLDSILAAALASSNVGSGASLVGISDVAGRIIATNVENALQEIALSRVTSDYILDLNNSSGIPISNAIEVASTISDSTVGLEASLTTYSFLLSGAKVLGCTMSGKGILLPQGPGVGIEFDPLSGGRTVIGYDIIGPYIWMGVNGTAHFHRIYQNLVILDFTQTSGGYALDTSLSGGLYSASSGASITLRAGTIDGLECKVSGGIVWGRAVAGATITAAKAITYNSSGNGIVADATTPTKCMGVTVAGAGNGTNLRFVRNGIATGVISAATPGTPYYLGTAGVLTTTKNVTSGQAQIQVGVAASATDLDVQISDRGVNP